MKVSLPSLQSLQQWLSYRRRLALVSGVLALAIPAGARARQMQQIPPASQSGRPQSPGNGLGEPHDPFAAQSSSKLEHMREDERRKRLLADTAKLVALSNELKTEVDDTSRDELSLEVIRKATEIEKLAHDVRERMKS